MIEPRVDGSKLESLLASERAIMPISDEARARIIARARWAARLPAGQPGAASTASGWAWLRGSPLFAAASLGVLLVALGAAALHGARSPMDAHTNPPDLSSAETAARSLSVGQPGNAPEPSAGQVPPTVQSGELVAREMAQPSSEHASPVLSRRRARVNVNRPAQASDSRAGELSLLQLAREACGRRDFPAALLAVAEHARRFPAGELQEEREALRIRALSGTGRREEARRAASVFRERFPKSVLLPSIQEMLAPSP